MHGEDVQRNTRPAFEGHKRDGLEGKKARRKRNWRCSWVWMARGSWGWGEAEAQGRAEAGEGISGAQEWRGSTAELGHAQCCASRTRTGEGAGTAPGAAELGEGEGSSTVEAEPQRGGAQVWAGAGWELLQEN